MQNDGNVMAEPEIPVSHKSNLFGVPLYIDPITGQSQQIDAAFQGQVIQHTAVTHVRRWTDDNVERWHGGGL